MPFTMKLILFSALAASPFSTLASAASILHTGISAKCEAAQLQRTESPLNSRAPLEAVITGSLEFQLYYARVRVGSSLEENMEP